MGFRVVPFDRDRVAVYDPIRARRGNQVTVDLGVRRFVGESRLIAMYLWRPFLSNGFGARDPVYALGAAPTNSCSPPALRTSTFGHWIHQDGAGGGTKMDKTVTDPPTP